MGHNGVVTSYTISTGIPRVDGCLTDPQILGHHTTPSPSDALTEKKHNYAS